MVRGLYSWSDVVAFRSLMGDMSFCRKVSENREDANGKFPSGTLCDTCTCVPPCHCDNVLRRICREPDTGTERKSMPSGRAPLLVQDSFLWPSPICQEDSCNPPLSICILWKKKEKRTFFLTNHLLNKLIYIPKKNRIDWLVPLDATLGRLFLKEQARMHC